MTIPTIRPYSPSAPAKISTRNIFMKDPLACTSTRAAEEPIIPTENPHARLTIPTMKPVAKTA